MKNVLVFSVALNGYQWRYGKLLDSHRQYAEHHGYHYAAVTRPVCSLLGMEIAWLKVRLILEALRAGYRAILFLDADTRIQPNAPPIEHCFQHNRCVYAAKGFSGRYNSGVLVIENKTESHVFFSNLLRSATSPLPEEDDVGWGENGHFIHLAKHAPYVGELDARWNNNHTPSLNDFVRHYSHGPLYNNDLLENAYRPSRAGLFLSKAIHYSLAIAKRMEKIRQAITGKNRPPHSFQHQLETFTQQVLSHYPAFSRSPQQNSTSACIAYSKKLFAK